MARPVALPFPFLLENPPSPSPSALCSFSLDFISRALLRITDYPFFLCKQCFSTLERLRIFRSADYNELDPPAQDGVDGSLAVLPFDNQDQLPRLTLGLDQDELDSAPHRRIEAKSSPLRIYARPGEGFVKPKIANMVSFSADDPPTATGPDLTAYTSTAGADSLIDSFRWLEESKDLDLSLLLDDYHFDLRNQDAATQTKRDPSFRRHLSISKLPFGNRASVTMSRPATKGTCSLSPAAASPHTSVPSSPAQGLARRRSRALSMITSNKQPAPNLWTFVDPAAAHYQDPDARMKLRVYLASAHKFDEAVEFGFPSIELVHDKEYARGYKKAASQQERSGSRLGTLLPFIEDDKSSTYTDDEVSTTETDSPRTPEIMEKPQPLPIKPVQQSRNEKSPVSNVDYAQAPAASREMTLRMTLTRPDLRANEEQIYGWQKMSTGRKSSQIKDEPQSPSSFSREGHSKESIEQRFAVMDQEDQLANEDGIMKRFWNRVRRA